VAMKVVLVDCLIYQGLLCYQRRRAAASPDRDEPITTRMKRAQYRSVPHSVVGNSAVVG
jgi:hypothetical protein